MISKIWTSHLEEHGYTLDKASSERIYLDSSKINLIVGVNNSGKSRLIRILFKTGQRMLKIEDNSIIDFLKDQDDLIKESFYPCYGSYVSLISESFVTQLRLEENLKRFTESCRNHAYSVKSTRKLASRETSLVNDLEKSIEYQLKLSPITNRFYIPVLRGMRSLDKNSDVLKQRTIGDYFKENEDCHVNIITGYDLYDKLQHFLLGQPEDRELVKHYEKLLGEEFFDGETITLIPEIKRDVVSIKIGNEKQFPIFDLGDGLQQVIIITSAIYLVEKPSLFFIEEPEAGLHPGLLKRLIDFLIKHTKHQYFLTTHSNHLLDLYHNYDCVTLHKITKKLNQSDVNFEITDCANDRTILSELGVSPSSVYLSNSTIWVEGITDRLYLRCFMQKYIESQCNAEKLKLQRYLENYHYSFVEYQGGTLGHWNFDDDNVDGGDVGGLCAVKLCANAFLIADGDIKSKGNRLDTLMSQLSDKLYVTKGKELENMLPDVIVKKVADEVFENSRKEKKLLNKSSIEGLAFESYSVSDDGIGFHLDRCLGLQGKGKENKRFFAEESGTIKNKVHFCNLAVKYMISNEIEWDLTDDLRNLCKKIFNHIESCNYL